MPRLPTVTAGVLARAALVAGDLLTLVAALAVAVGVRGAVLPWLSPAFARPTYPLAHYLSLWWLPAVYLGALWYAGLYTRRDPFWEEARRCVSGVTVAAVATFALLALAKVGDDVSRPVVVMAWAVLLVALPAARRVVKAALVRLGPWRQRVLVVGDGPQAARLAEALARAPTLGYDVAGVVDDPALAPERARALGARDVIVGAAHLGRAEFLALVERLRPVAENVLVAPDVSEMPVLGVEVVGLFEDRALLLRVPNNLLRPWNVVTKRAFDLLAGAALAAVALPVLAAAAVAVRLTSPGPAFHVEPRVGRGRRLFPCYKLRTMYVDADARLAAFLRDNPGAAEEWERYWKLRGHDPRVTPVGRWLRRWGLDELPQVLNVLRGEMSLVGPRPYLPRELPLLPGDGMLDVPPGLTGLWQVSGKNALDYRQRVHLDRWYVNNWSLWLDVIILAKTVPAVLRGEAQVAARAG
ncbi:MAG: exopolysaccharide biosynthesis polyprenyl glycosylphosphotransferase [Armatimonadota bacterium]|nr:exopolysaccharide biosynthesis polyprenyl glycosylphosphotransferase [Armatimonadota bacterium]